MINPAHLRAQSLLFRPPKHKGPLTKAEVVDLEALEFILDALHEYDPIKVRYVRKDIQWVQRASQKYLGIQFDTPYKHS